MQNSEFEKSVQQKMEDLNIAPSGDLWGKIEANLPAEKKPRRWLMFILLFVVFTGTSLLLWDNVVPSNDQFHNNQDGFNETIARNDLPADPNTPALPILPADESTEKNKPLKPSLSIVEKKAGLELPPGKNIWRNEEAKDSSNSSIKKRNKIQINERLKTSIKTAVPAAEQDDDPEAVATTLTAPLNTIVLNDSTQDPSHRKPMQAPDTSTDSLQKTHIDPKTTLAEHGPKKKKNAVGWVYGIHAGAGFSSVKTGLFKSTPIYADAQAYNSSTGSTGNPAAASPSSPEGSVSFSAGLYVQKKLSTRWTFYTGLNYSYQSNTLKVGNTVDSATRLFYFASRNIQANRFYRTGNAGSYKNKFHMAEMPLLVQYNVSKKWPLHLKMGAVIGYLCESNALVYNSGSRAYVTDEAMFNKLGVSIAGGAGFDLAKKSRLPFSLGYRFSYGISPVTKEAYGKQHLLNSIFYLDVPLKK